jgi:type IV pilus assembly protein PilW
MKPRSNLIFNLRATSGRSLVEIMIALTIGMVILIAISSLFIGNRQTFRSTDDKTRLDEEGRLALSMMAFHIRMAGYGTMMTSDEKYTSETPGPTYNQSLAATYTNYSDRKTGTAVNAIRGCAGGFADTATDAAAIGCAAGTTSDSFLVRYVVDQNIIASGGALPTDCLGANVILSPAIPEQNGRPGTAAYYLIENRFFVQNNGVTGVPELYCRGNGNTPPGTNLINPAQPIAENVENMKITYGLSTAGSATTQNVNRYVTADLMGPGDWERVVSMRVCIVVRSANDNVATARQEYRDCNDTQVVAADRRLRGVFSTTVAIRSRSVGAT